MIGEELVFVATCDISGLARGKGFPARELRGRLKKGVGWTGSNLMMSPFGPIWDTPFGTAGDFMIMPDPSVEVRVDFADGSAIEHFFLGDICNTDGSPWECCPRDFLRRAVKQLDDLASLRLVAAFEQEFLYTGVSESPGDAYALGAFRRQDGFGGTFTTPLRAAGAVPRTLLALYGPPPCRASCMPEPAPSPPGPPGRPRATARPAAHPPEGVRNSRLDFRATDAAASPYLALGAGIVAGVDGIRRGLELPKSGRAEHLPHSLPEALDRLAADETVAGWFGPTHFDAYIRFKRVEAEKMAGVSPAAPSPPPPQAFLCPPPLPPRRPRPPPPNPPPP